MTSLFITVNYLHILKTCKRYMVVLFVNFSKVIILQTTICITLFYLLTRREYAPPIINNYPAKSGGISPDDLADWAVGRVG